MLRRMRNARPKQSLKKLVSGEPQMASLVLKQVDPMFFSPVVALAATEIFVD